MTTASETTNFYGELEETPPAFSKRWFSRIGTFAFIGFLLLLTNFPMFLMRLIDANVVDRAWRTALHAPIQAVQALIAVIIGPDAGSFFERAMTCSFVLLWLFIIFLAVFSVRRRGIRMLAYGLGGIVVGYLALHALAWAAFAVAMTIRGVIFVVHWAGIGIAAVVAFLFGSGWPLLLAVIIAGAVLLVRRFRNRLYQLLRRVLLLVRKYATALLGLAIIGGLLWLLVPLFYRWVVVPVVQFFYQLIILPVFQFLTWLLSPVFRALLFVIKWLLTIILTTIVTIVIVSTIAVTLALLGSLLVTQLQAGWHAARSLRHVLIAGFAIGSALALVVLESVATASVAAHLNHAWIEALALFHIVGAQDTTHFVTVAFQIFLPQSVERFVFAELTNLQAPALDSLIFLAIMSLACLSVLFRVFSTRPIEDEYVPVTLVAWEYTKMAVGLFVALVIIFLMALSGDSHAH